MARRLTVLAAAISQEFPDLVAVAEAGAGYCNTDRKIPGTRLRHPGKGRRGTLLTVKNKTTGEVILRHNAAETYRSNQEMEDWILNERKRRSRREN